MRNIALILLMLLCARMGDTYPAPEFRPHFDRVHPRPLKILPISLRYRQQIQEQIHLPPCQPHDLRPAASPASAPQSPLVARADIHPPGIANDLSAPMRC